MDTKVKSETEVERLFSNLDKPSLHALSYALRHPDTWPDGFVWSYSHCNQCAMGLAHQLWHSSIPKPSSKRNVGSSGMARAFKMPYDDASKIFFLGSDAYRRKILGFKCGMIDYDSVTPEKVADAIDQYLATAE